MVRRQRSGSVGERFRAGDERALAEVFDEYAGPMLAVAGRMLADRRLAEEAVQQAFVQAWRAVDVRSGTPAGPLAAVDRAAHGGRPLAPRAPSRGAQPRRGRPGRPALGRAALDRRRGRRVGGPPGHRRAAAGRPEVVRLAHLEQLTQPEIAARLGVPLGTVKSRTAYRVLAAALSSAVALV